MLISKDDAKKIAELSYDLHAIGLIKRYMTFKKAMELDVDTGKKALDQLLRVKKLEDMKEEVRGYGGALFDSGHEIVVVDNYLYLESIEYDVKVYPINSSNGDRIPQDIKCTFSDGSVCVIPSGLRSRMYAPNIYNGYINGYTEGIPLLPANGPYPSLNDPYKRVLYLKTIIAEDRLINPYMLRSVEYRGLQDNYMFPMYEATRALQSSGDEIDLLNQILKATGGYLITDLYDDKINVIASALYLESIDRYDLSLLIRQYEKDTFALNSVIEHAKLGYYGVAFNSKFKEVVLI